MASLALHSTLPLKNYPKNNAGYFFADTLTVVVIK